MTEQEYNSAEGIRRSDLWIMADSPEKFRYHMGHPEEEKSAALIFGRACHKYVLELEDFDKEYAVAPVAVDRRTKEGKEIWNNFLLNLNVREPVTNEDCERLAGMRGALMRHPLAWGMLQGQHEVPFFWSDPETGEKCKCKADVVNRSSGLITLVDYKTTGDARSEAFNRSIYKYGYHVQAAMYAEGVKIALGLDYVPDFVFVAQEKNPPYAVNVIRVSDNTMEYGSRIYHKLLSQYHGCRLLDIWEGYCGATEPNESYVPGYMEAEMEEE